MSTTKHLEPDIKPPLTPAQRQARRQAKGVQVGIITSPEAISALRALQASGLTMREAVEQALVAWAAR